MMKTILLFYLLLLATVTDAQHKMLPFDPVSDSFPGLKIAETSFYPILINDYTRHNGKLKETLEFDRNRTWFLYTRSDQNLNFIDSGRWLILPKIITQLNSLMPESMNEPAFVFRTYSFGKNIFLATALSVSQLKEDVLAANATTRPYKYFRKLIKSRKERSYFMRK